MKFAGEFSAVYYRETAKTPFSAVRELIIEKIDPGCFDVGFPWCEMLEPKVYLLIRRNGAA